MRVLIVEDEPFLAEAIRDGLRRAAIAAGHRACPRQPLDRSRIAQDAPETRLPPAEKRDLTSETAGDSTPTRGAPARLRRRRTTLVHNAIGHHPPAAGTVGVTTHRHPQHAVLTVENTGQPRTPQGVATLVEPFQRRTARIRTAHAAVGRGRAIVNRITQAPDGPRTRTPGPRPGAAGPGQPASAIRAPAPGQKP